MANIVSLVLRAALFLALVLCVTSQPLDVQPQALSRVARSAEPEPLLFNGGFGGRRRFGGGRKFRGGRRGANLGLALATKGLILGKLAIGAALLG